MHCTYRIAFFRRKVINSSQFLFAFMQKHFRNRWCVLTQHAGASRTRGQTNVLVNSLSVPDASFSTSFSATQSIISSQLCVTSDIYFFITLSNIVPCNLFFFCHTLPQIYPQSEKWIVERFTGGSEKNRLKRTRVIWHLCPHFKNRSVASSHSSHFECAHKCLYVHVCAYALVVDTWKSFLSHCSPSCFLFLLPLFHLCWSCFGPLCLCCDTVSFPQYYKCQGFLCMLWLLTCHCHHCIGPAYW